MCVRRTPISGFPFHFRSQAHFGAQVCLLEFFVGLAHADDLSQSCLQGLESFGHLDFSTDKVSAALSAGACLQLRIVDRGYRRCVPWFWLSVGQGHRQSVKEQLFHRIVLGLSKGTSPVNEQLCDRIVLGFEQKHSGKGAVP